MAKKQAAPKTEAQAPADLAPISELQIVSGNSNSEFPTDDELFEESTDEEMSQDDEYRASFDGNTPLTIRQGLNVRIKKLRPDAIVPEYQTSGAACFDLHALNDGRVRNSAVVFDTGLAFEVPEGYVMMLYSRSGHGFKNDVRMSNCVGVIDSDYRGEVRVKMVSDGGDGLNVYKGDRVAQAMLMPVPRVMFEVVDELSDTVRGDGGYGSTGA